MLLTKEETLRVIILTGYYLKHEGYIVNGKPPSDLQEVQLLRRIATEHPDLSTYVALVLRGG